jgi:hypothetical protein
MKILLIGIAALSLATSVYANRNIINNVEIQIKDLQSTIKKHGVEVINFDGENYRVSSRSDISAYAVELASNPLTRNLLFGQKWKTGFDPIDFVWNATSSNEHSEFSYIALKNFENNMPKLSEEELKVRARIQSLEKLSAELGIQEIERLRTGKRSLDPSMIRLPENSSRRLKVNEFLQNGKIEDIKAIFGDNYKAMLEPVDFVYNETGDIAAQDYVNILNYYLDMYQSK